MGSPAGVKLLQKLGIGSLLNKVREAVIIGDAKTGEIVGWNDYAEHLFGYTQEEALGMQIHELVPSYLRSKHDFGLKHFAETGEMLRDGEFIEVCAERKYGQEIWLELSLSPIGDEPGRYVLALARDVTPKRWGRA